MTAGLASKLRRTLLPLVISGLLSLLACELLLRAFTTNHYENLRLADGTTVFLPLPGTRVFGTSGLYEGGGKIALRVTADRFIHPGYEAAGEKRAIFVGGSTTECAMLDEGERWPDLLGKRADFYPLNYGRSDKTVFDTGRALDLILDEYAPDASYIFMMHAINDLSEFAKTTRSQPAWDGRDLYWSDKLKRSYLIALAAVAVNNVRSKQILPFYLSEKRNNAAIAAELSEQQFEQIVASDGLTEFFERRERGYLRIIERSRAAGIPLILLTQPTSYRGDYEPFGADVRVYPVFYGRRLSLAQTNALHRLFNAHTRTLAEKYEVSLIDVEKHFDTLEVSPLFYDSCHYTPNGSEAVADFIASELVALGLR